MAEIQLYTYPEAARILKCEPITIRRWIAQGLLRGTVIGGKKYVRHQDIEAATRPKRGRPRKEARG